MKIEKIKKMIVPIFLVTIAFIMSIVVFDKKIDTNGDNAGYVSLAKSLANGHGFKFAHDYEQKPANSFPPGYPLLLGVAFKLSRNSYRFAKMLNSFFYIASVLLAFMFFKKISRNTILAFTAATGVLLNGYILRYSTILMSEISFMFFTLWALYLFVEMNTEEPPLRNRRFYETLFLFSYAYYVRTAGLSAIGGILLFFLIARNFKYFVAYAIGFFVIAFPWFLRGKILGGNSYVNQLLQINIYRPELGPAGVGDLLVRFLTNTKRYITAEIPNGILQILPANYDTPTISNWIAGIIVISLICFGIYKMTEIRRFIISYLIAVFGILLLWPSVWNGIRFVLPTMPLIIFLFINGLNELSKLLFDKFSLKSNKYFPLIFSLLFLTNSPSIGNVVKQKHLGYHPVWQNYISLANWSKNNLEKDAVIACRKPNIFALFSDRYTTVYKYTLDSNELINDMKKKHVKYVVVDELGFSSGSRYLKPAIQKNLDKFIVVAIVKNPDTYLLKFKD